MKRINLIVANGLRKATSVNPSPKKPVDIADSVCNSERVFLPVICLTFKD